MEELRLVILLQCIFAIIEDKELSIIQLREMKTKLENEMKCYILFTKAMVADAEEKEGVTEIETVEKKEIMIDHQKLKLEETKEEDILEIETVKTKKEEATDTETKEGGERREYSYRKPRR